MQQLFQQFQRYTTLRALAYIILGFLSIMHPEKVLKIIATVIGTYLLFLALANLFTAFKMKRNTGYVGIEFMIGAFFLIASLGIFVFAKALLAIVPFFLGLTIILNGCLRLFQGLNANTYGIKPTSWIIYSIILIIAGGILLFNPFQSGIVLLQMFGGIILFIGVSELIAYWQMKNN